jgi:hypothetical protein
VHYFNELSTIGAENKNYWLIVVQCTGSEFDLSNNKKPPDIFFRKAGGFFTLTAISEAGYSPR